MTISQLHKEIWPDGTPVTERSLWALIMLNRVAWGIPEPVLLEGLKATQQHQAQHSTKILRGQKP